jgi:predicted Rossmann-fold nucleotide-binding protein
MDARIAPEGSLDILSRQEVNRLRDAGSGGLYELWRQCSLAVLNAGSEEDDIYEIMRRNREFRIAVDREEGGIAVELKNAPDSAFVDGEMIRGIREHLFSVLRDLLFADETALDHRRLGPPESRDLTDAVFEILRNAQVLKTAAEPSMVVCWGGHAISRQEYDYTKRVGYALGLRGFDVCTGCGAGAMKGPMKGAAIGHAKQRLMAGRYVGLTEPTIIAVEAPNPIVNELVILPDMEKRLEAFLRMAHGIVIFPGGAGTAEELLYLLGVLLHPDNADIEIPVIVTGPPASAPYFDLLSKFIGATMGPDAERRYQVIIDDPDAVGHAMAQGLDRVRASRRANGDAFFFNWRLKIAIELQTPFAATHESMAALDLSHSQSQLGLAVNLRRAFSGIVAGNVRAEGVKLVSERGPFEISGDPQVIAALEELLNGFIAEKRMKLSDPINYKPCFRIVA